MEQDQSNPAFTDGYDSGRDSAPRTDNPHKANSAEAEQWLQGWDEGLAKRDAVNTRPQQPTPASRRRECHGTSHEPRRRRANRLNRGKRAVGGHSRRGRRPANPYPADSPEAEEWLDGHDYATSTNENEITLPIRQEPIVGEEVPSQAVKVPAAGEE